MDDFNPYAAPEVGLSPARLPSVADEGRGVWRDGEILIMAKPARLPSRCLKCNEPATYHLKQTLAWHAQWYFLLVLLGLLFYVVVALLVRKVAKVQLPLCELHRARRSRGIRIGWVISLTGLALCFAPAVLDPPWSGIGVISGLFMFLFGLIFGLFRARVVLPTKIDDTHLWLKKVSPFYLAELAPLPISRG